MALEGTLRDFSFADILQLISLQRKTGVLTLKSDDNVVTVSFLDGKVVGANALNQQAQDRLGLVLLRSGKITERQLEEALREQEESLQRLGKILIERGYATAEDVRSALEQQILQLIYRVFRWQDGEYHFSQETDIDYDRDLMIPLSTDSIIMEGARMTDEWPFIERRLPDRSVILVKTDPARVVEVAEAGEEELDEFEFTFAETPEATPPEPTPGNALTPNQFTIYNLITGRETLGELIERSPLVEFETCKAVVELLDRGLIREATPEEIARALEREAERPVSGAHRALRSIPWLALPFLALLGFSAPLTVRNPLNPAWSGRSELVNRYVLEPASALKLRRVLRELAAYRDLHGQLPESPVELAAGGGLAPEELADPWGRPYRIVVRGDALLVAGADAAGQPVPILLVSRRLAASEPGVRASGPGVVLIE